MTQAVIYLRYSPRPGGGDDSIASQDHRCRAFVAAMGWSLRTLQDGREAVFTDEEKSATLDAESLDPSRVMAKRPGLVAALEALRPGDVLVVRWMSRLARSAFLDEYLRRLIRAQGCRAVAADEPNGDDDDPYMVFVRQILASLAEMDSRVLKQRMRSAYRHALRSERGRRWGGNAPPFGWDWDGERHMKPVPEQQAALRALQPLVGLGLPLWDIAEAMNAMGHRWKRGEPWTSYAVETALRFLAKWEPHPSAPAVRMQDDGPIAFPRPEDLPPVPPPE